jgi:hypothetical protein
MPGLPPQHRCHSCDGALYLFQEECTECSTSHHWFYLAPCRTCGTEIDYLAGPCPDCGTEHSPWRAVEFEALTSDPVAVSKRALPRPIEAGYRRHLGMVKGQWADYRRVREDGSDFHVRVYSDHYELHLDRVSAIDDPAMHALTAAPRLASTAGIGVLQGVQGTVERSGDLLTRTLQTPSKLFSDHESQ